MYSDPIEPTVSVNYPWTDLTGDPERGAAFRGGYAGIRAGISEPARNASLQGRELNAYGRITGLAAICRLSLARETQQLRAVFPANLTENLRFGHPLGCRQRLARNALPMEPWRGVRVTASAPVR